MEYSYEKVSSNKAKLSFGATAEEFGEAIQKVYLKNRGQIAVPGFRKGKAPRKVIERMYGKGIFYEDAMEELFQYSYAKAVKEYELKVVDRPVLAEPSEIEEGKEVTFSVTVFVEPDVQLGEYKGLAVKRLVKKVTDEDVDARIEQERNAVARSIDVTDRAVEDGDTIRLDYKGTVDGVVFEGGIAQDQKLEIGSGSFIPGFESQLVGMNIGEEKKITVTFPENYHAEELQGKEAVFHVKVNGITREELPALDDEFASEVSDFDTLAEYRADLQRTMQEANDKAASDKVKSALVRRVAKEAEIDVPAPMVEERLDEMLKEMSWNMQRQGFSMEQFLKLTGNTPEKLREMYRPQALDAVRQNLTIAAIGKAEGIEASEEDVDALLSNYAANMHESLESLKATMSPYAMDTVKTDVISRKVVDFLLENAVLTDTEDEDELDNEEKEAFDVPTDEEMAEIAETAEEAAEEKPEA